ncbi:hypothetical protein [Alloalcanivorax venustensis]|jgi:hypothetical protein|nr:hypothetical protein [Alloalcanivorax venustensis]|tara:strand:- start:144 stop:590 length:447 start_codon:yes stop_codon:yes gene_type:complete
MTLGLLLKESMSGWLALDSDGVERPFSFTIRAFTTRIFSLGAPRYFRGTARLGDHQCPCEGELRIRLSGPHYWLHFRHPELGELYAEGQKQYGQGGWIQSLITCPLTVYQADRPVGKARVAYRDSMLAFPFKALRLVDERHAYQDAAS